MDLKRDSSRWLLQERERAGENVASERIAVVVRNRACDASGG